MQTINFDKLNVKSSDLVLDIGCGEGRHSLGLYVDKEYRNKGLSQILLRQAILQGKREDCHWIWSMPRKTALPAYQKIG